ncbi:hypothetical protein AB4Z34_34660 [Ensifer sp. 2YAB10]|uniref:hypothetical protein n=1 Tax=Ensifer sp. 2YAB10 TaxID=3233021 RepID=UPI003F90AFFB
MEQIATKRSLPSGVSESAIAKAEFASKELRRVARKARFSRPVVSGGFRVRRSDKLFRYYLGAIFVMAVVVPTIAAVGYFSFVAADQFTAEARFSVASGDTSALDALAGVSSLIQTGQAKNTIIISEYISSRPMVDALEKSIGLRRVFRPGNGDFVAQVSEDATAEELLKYWKRHVSVDVNRTSGLATLYVSTFSPGDSLKIATEIIGLSESVVNNLTQKSDIDAFEMSKLEVNRAKSELETATSRLRDARNTAGVLDVKLSAEVTSTLISQLRSALANIEVQIATLKASDAAGAPQMTPLQHQADSIKDQIAGYEASMAARSTSEGEVSLATRATNIQDREVQAEIARSIYADAVLEYERARITLEKKRSYLLTYVTPRLPEEALYPRRILFSLAVFLLGALIWGILGGIGWMVRDHMAAS